MAQASSAQREPSMEEILASIRRIIEDSDTARNPENDDAVADVPAEAGLHAEAAGDVEAFRKEFDTEPVVMQASKPASLAEIQAEVAREHGVEPSGAGNLRIDQIAVTREQETAANEYGDPAGDDDPTAFPIFESVRAENQNPKPAILSEHTGRQVAAAFGELSDAFAASRRKSFDEMAEEMLRPMLQDWLDNNLPVLVERLVREEIERVARGGV